MSPRNEAVVSAMQDLLNHARVTPCVGGGILRRAVHGPLLLMRFDTPDAVLLDAWLSDVGKIAAFRASPTDAPFRCVSFDTKCGPTLLRALGLTTFLPPAQVIPFPTREAHR
jgi:hypothetical protein